MIIAPSAEANKECIARELAKHPPFRSAKEKSRCFSCLEIGSGTGQRNISRKLNPGLPLGLPDSKAAFRVLAR
jgi:hypothetical protein